MNAQMETARLGQEAGGGMVGKVDILTDLIKKPTKFQCNTRLADLLGDMLAATRRIEIEKEVTADISHRGRSLIETIENARDARRGALADGDRFYWKRIIDEALADAAWLFRLDATPTLTGSLRIRRKSR